MSWIFHHHVNIMKKVILLLAFLLLGSLGFAQSRYISATTKQIVYSRDGGVCQCCGSSLNLEFDHITPFSCGGSSDASNIQLLCLKCNRSKSNSCYCKVHDKRVGHNCCDGKTASQSSGFQNSGRTSQSASQQCGGTTKKGDRCRNMTTNSNSRCHHHQ